MATNNSINQSCKVTTYTSNDTWTKDSRSKFISLYIFGGGNGGGSGRRGASGAAGGGAGAAGAGLIFLEAPAGYFDTTATVTVGVGGSGGAAQTSDNTNGNNGAFGGRAYFGSICTDLAGTAAGGGINGTADSGYAGAICNNLFSESNSLPGGYGNKVAGTNGTDNKWGPISAGAGGGGGANSGTEYAGGNSGSLVARDTTVLAAGVAGGTESGTINGTAGTSYTSGTKNCFLTGIAGAGGGGQKSGAAAGNGGNGGYPSGAGGGGGGSLNSTNSGAGGNGANGMLVVIEHF